MDSQKEHICKCNNCDVRLFDENPKDETTQEAEGNELNMVQIEEEGEFFWACPNCETDSFLMDID